MKHSIFSRIRRAEKNLISTNLTVLCLLGGVYFSAQPIVEFMSGREITSQEKKLGNIIFLLSAITGLGISGWNIKRAIPGLKNPAASRITKKLAKNLDLKQVFPKIETELRDTNPIKCGDHKIYLTKNWLVYQTLYDFMPIEYTSIIWFYKSVTEHKVNNINARQSHQIVIFDRYGQRYQIGIPNNDVDRVFRLIQSQASGAIVGYQEDLLKIWAKNKQVFLETVKPAIAKLL